MEHNLSDRQLAAQVDLQPLHRVGRRRKSAVVAVGRTGIAVGELWRLLDQFVEFGQPRAGRLGDLRLDLLRAGFKRLLLCVESHMLPHQFGIGRILPILAVDRRKDRLQRVVVVLRDGVELVVVALGAVDRDARERADRVGHHVVAVEVAGDLAVGLGLRHLAVADQVPRSGGDEADCLLAVGRIGKEHVTGDLLLDEPGIGLVGVERADDVIAIGPGIRPRLVLVVAVGVAVVDDVEPVPGPAFAVAGRGQQPVDEFLVGRGIGIGDEGIHFFGRRRQARQVEREPADERAAVGDHRRREFVLGELRANEEVDGVAFGLDACNRRERVHADRHGRLRDRLPGPVVEPRIADGGGGRIVGAGPGCIRIDPGSDGGDLILREPLALGRHHLFGVRRRDPPDEFALRPLPRDDRGTEVAPLEHRSSRVEPQTRFLGVGTVALHAAGGKNGPRGGMGGMVNGVGLGGLA